MFDLLSSFAAVIANTYPADVYSQLELRMGSPGTAKTDQDHRRADARRLHDWCAESQVILDDELRRQIDNGFGPAKDGEDLFDAAAGLFGMITTILAGREPPLPDDPALREVLGWMFGQPAR